MRPRTKEETAAYLAGYEAGRSVKRPSQWQPIESAPKFLHGYGYDDDRPFAVMNSAGYCAAATFVTETGYAYYTTAEDEHTTCSSVAHWMPLPEPPK